MFETQNVCLSCGHAADTSDVICSNCDGFSLRTLQIEELYRF